jgi:hypothetical protein
MMTCSNDDDKSSSRAEDECCLPNYSKNAGIVISRGALFAFQAKDITPPALPEQLAIAKALVQNGTFAAVS